MLLEFGAGGWGTLSKLRRLEEDGTRQGHIQTVPGKTTQLMGVWEMDRGKG